MKIAKCKLKMGLATSVCRASAYTSSSAFWGAGFCAICLRSPLRARGFRRAFPSANLCNNSSDAGMTPDQLAEAKQYGRLELLCGLADKAIDLLFLAAAHPAGPAAGPLAANRPLAAVELVAAAGRVVSRRHGPARGRFLSAFVLFRLLVGAAISTEHAAPGPVGCGATPSGTSWPPASARR